MKHLTEEQLERVLSGRPQPGGWRVLRHLLACFDCGGRLVEWLEQRGEEPRDEAVPALDPQADAAYEAAFDRAAARVKKAAPTRKQREQLARVLAEARTHPQGILGPAVLRRYEALPAPLRIEALLQHCAELRFKDPERMRRVAAAATAATAGLEAELGPALAADLRARVYAEWANAERINENLGSAEAALAEAGKYLDKGTQDPWIWGRVLEIEASLRKHLRDLESANVSLEGALDCYRKLGDRHLTGRVMIKKGMNTVYLGEPHEAVKLFRDGLALLDSARDPQLLPIGQQGLLDALVDCGRYQEASALLLRSGLRQAFAGEPRNLLKLRWVEGKIFAGLGKLDRAEKAFEEVHQEFWRRGESFEAVTVGLELAGVWLQQGKSAAARRLAAEALVTLSELKASPEALRALAYLDQACRQELATPGLVRKVVHFLGRLEWQPHLRFSASS